MVKYARLPLLLVLVSILKFGLAQEISGTLIDKTSNDPLIAASILVKGTNIGASTDLDGKFYINWNGEYPVTLICSYIGYSTLDYTVESAGEYTIALSDNATLINTVEVKGQRISDKQKESALTIEALDNVAIKQAASSDFYESLGNLKGVDLTTASLGFKVVNTRGFNSTSPVRSLQIIDGIDNQSPGLNFSLGNFLGVPDLDINRVELIAGASSAFYGPNAFNGVISMQTKNPFIHKGLSVEMKLGERNLFSTAMRWADSFKDKNGYDRFAYKVNMYHLTAQDWEAENYDSVEDSESKEDNPGGYDAVNVYGDEYFPGNDFSSNLSKPGLGIFHRTGYQEDELVDYEATNLKANLALHYRLQPQKELLSPEIILSSSYGGGTTVYQGDNRFYLDNIRFYQHRLELRKENHYFLRAYATHEDAGDSYDPYFTALQLQNDAKSNGDWAIDYDNHWSVNVKPFLEAQDGYPRGVDYIGDIQGLRNARNDFMNNYVDSLPIWHQRSEDFANQANAQNEGLGRYEPGTARFDSAFQSITSLIASEEGGTRFYDKSALTHIHGEYKFNDLIQNQDVITDLDITIGANARWYFPDSRGSILLDTAGRDIQTFEYGSYVGASLGLGTKIKLNASLRQDKHQNYDLLFSPALSLVYNPKQNQFLRMSFSSAIRNPTLSDQFLFYNVGPAILIGNLEGINDVYSVVSFINYTNTRNVDTLDQFDIAPIRPEQVRSFELGYRSTLFDDIYVDMSYYYSIYTDFIGFQLAVESDFDNLGIPNNTQVYRVSANAQDQVTTQGFALGLSYYFRKYYSFNGNYSWNRLNTATDDPIIPAFNTPEHKYNLGISGRDIPLNLGLFKLNNFGFNFVYKWIQGFTFEGSPQFTGFIPTYDLLDGQVNVNFESINTIFKIGATNLLDNQVFQTYGGPRIGRLAYIALTYQLNKR